MSNFRTPRNTERAMHEDPIEAMLFLAAAMGGNPSTPIEAQEAAGQRELVNSDVIPSQINGGSEADLTSLGFVLGEQVDGDPMFRRATLPAGWKREGSDHSMGSYIVDGLGRRRCGIFYKAAFYDRSAHISVTSVYGYVSECLHDGKTPVLDDEWATKSAVLAAVEQIRDTESEQIDFWTQHGNQQYVEESREKIANCEALRQRIEAA
ncbi:MAG: hypothetical protein JWO67_1559 [Streptosporangiaceae bacterium]|nr:hypothetical protein [Streptosporangiaceae bacterium]